jgi:hypothetical protein
MGGTTESMLRGFCGPCWALLTVAFAEGSITDAAEICIEGSGIWVWLPSAISSGDIFKVQHKIAGKCQIYPPLFDQLGQGEWQRQVVIWKGVCFCPQ